MKVFSFRRCAKVSEGLRHSNAGLIWIASSRAFSLVEMLAVIAVIGLIAATTAPMLFSTMKANRLTAAGEEVANRISLAQQMAVSRNHEVELRFYRFVDPEDSGAGDHYRATLVVEPAADPNIAGAADYTVLSDVSYLRGGIVVASSDSLSPALAESGRQENEDSEGIIRSAPARYRSIRFYPDGSCDVTVKTNEGYVTVADARDVANSGGEPPKNFFAIQLDHYTSRVTTYRP